MLNNNRWYCFSSFSFHPRYTLDTTQSPATYRSILMIQLLWHVCVVDGRGEYRDLVEAFTDWIKKNCLVLNTTKTKELVVDFRRSKTPCKSVCIEEEEYLGVVWLINWSGLPT